MRWVYRTALISCFTAMVYITLLPKYNFTNWVPDQRLTALGLPAQWLNWLNYKSDKFAHFFGAFIVTTLFLLSRKKTLPTKDLESLYWLNNRWLTNTLGVLALLSLAIGAEFAQLYIGRQFSIEDIIVGTFGGAVALSIGQFRQTPIQKRQPCYKQSS